MTKRVLSVILCLLLLGSIIPLSTLSASAGSAPVITVEYADVSAYRGDFCEVILKVECDEEVTYQWQKGFVDSTDEMVDLPENDIYKGVNTNHFKFKAIENLWVYDYRCKITYSGGTVYTDRFIFMFLDPLPIETARVTGLEKPKFGYTPDYEIDFVDSYKYQDGDVEWYSPNYNGTGWVKMNSTDVFAEGAYKCRVYLDPVEGYTFNEDSVARVDRLNCMVTKTTDSEGKDVFYAERYYTVNYDGTLPEGLLEFEQRTPDTEGTLDYYLGACYLGTDSMNMSFSFEPKALPLNMARLGYYVAENTRIANIKNESLYYANEGTSVNFADYAKIKGKYYVEQTIYLMSPEDERMASKEASYVIDVYEPQVVTSAGITFNGFNTWTKPFYTYVAGTPEIEFNTIFWYDITDGKTPIRGEEEFISGHTYRMEIWLGARAGYVFAVDEEGHPDITAKVNGMPAEVMPAGYNTKAEIAFEFTYKSDSTDTTEPSTEEDTTTETTTEEEVTTETATEEGTTAEVGNTTEGTDATEATDTTEGTDATEGTDTTEPSAAGILGDANCDGKVNVKDATAIQKHIAQLQLLGEIGAFLADVDASSNVNIKDATAIQKYVAGMDTGLPIGQII